MDSEQSHDIHAPDVEYRVDRWRRAGATPAQIHALYVEAMAQSEEVREASNARIDGVSNQDLAELLTQRFGAEPVPEVAAETLAAQEAEAIHGEWTPTEPIEVDGVEYPTWSLAHGFYGALIGDEETGEHVTALGLDELKLAVAEQVSGAGEPSATTETEPTPTPERRSPLPDLDEWQRQRHLARLADKA